MRHKKYSSQYDTDEISDENENSSRIPLVDSNWEMNKTNNDIDEISDENENSSRIPLVVGNWKMNKTYNEAVQLTQLITDRLERPWRKQIEIVICPPYTALKGVDNVIIYEHSFAKVGAQNCAAEDKGAYTGEISPVMLKNLHCEWCIVGHSERRTLFDETDADVVAKCSALARHGIAPIVCVGEPIEIYDAGYTVEFVMAQLYSSLIGAELGDVDLAIAYEPIWAIGTGNIPTPEHVQLVAESERAVLKNLYGEERAKKIRLLYGGSVRPNNVGIYISCPDIDGVLVGGDSLEAESFIDVIKGVLNA